MRYVVGLALALAAVTVSVSAGAQDSGEHPLKLELGEGGVNVAPSSQETGYTKQEMEHRVKRTKVALGMSVVPIAVGGFLYLFSYSEKRDSIICFTPPCPSEQRESLRIPGAAVLVGGAVWMVVAGTMHSVRRRKLQRLQQAPEGTPSRVQWGLARSELVF